MTNIRALTQTFVISACMALGLWQLAPAQAPASFSMGFRALVLIPFGTLCPLLTGGCLVHSLMERRSISAAAVFRAVCILLTLCAAAVFFYLRHTG